jgi:hypothetical protein
MSVRNKGDEIVGKKKKGYEGVLVKLPMHIRRIP